MLSDSAMMKLSLLIAIIGIILLFLFTQFLEPTRINISDINRNTIGQKVSVSGTISSLTEKDGHYFFTLAEGQNTIKTVIFNNKAEKLRDKIDKLSNNEFITVHGEVSLYRNELEIIIDNIE